MDGQECRTTKVSLEDRITRLEMGNLYRCLTRRLIQIYDEQRLQEKIRHQGLDSALSSAVESQGHPKPLRVRDLAKRLQKSAKWIYAHAGELGGTRVGRSWIFIEEAFQNAILGQERSLAGTGEVGRAKVQKGLQNQARRHSMGSRNTSGTGDATEPEAPDRHGLGDLL